MPRIQHGEVLVPADVAEAGIKNLAAELHEEYKDIDPLYVGMLTGAFVVITFTTMEMVKIDPTLNPEVDFIRIGSYGAGTKSGEPRVLADLAESTVVEDRHVILMDDILDTGKTMRLGIQHMRSLGASGVSLGLLSARESDANREVTDLAEFNHGEEVRIHTAVTIPNDAFVIGLGLNGPKGGRVLPYIAEHGN